MCVCVALSCVCVGGEGKGGECRIRLTSECVCVCVLACLSECPLALCLSYYDMLIAVIFELLLCCCCCKDVMGNFDCIAAMICPPTAESADAGWRCPGCRSVSTVIPSVYKCFCGKVVDPCAGRSHRDMTIPHSCGEDMVSPVFFFLTSLPS